MKLRLIIVLLCCSIFMYAAKPQATDKQLHIECVLEAKQDSCAKIIHQGVASVYDCDVKKECAVIGVIFHHAQRDREALPYFKKIHEVSDLDNYNSMGIFYKQKKDYVNAKKQFEQGCKNNYMKSCLNLGLLYDSGYGVKRDYNMAANLYTQACQGGIAEGCYNVGMLHHNGQIKQATQKSAQEFFTKSCDMGYQDGCQWIKKAQ